MSDWVVLVQFDHEHESGEAMSLLEAAEIPCVLQAVGGSLFMKPFDMVGSTVKLMVQEEDVKESLEILMDAGIVKPQDLGPDESMQWLEGHLERGGVQHMLRWAQKITLPFMAGFVLLLIVILISQCGGSSF